MADQAKFSKKLTGARVLIVGGSSGIGYAVAEGAVEFGAIVHIASSKPEKVENAVEKLKESYPSAEDRIFGHVCSLADKDTLEDNVIRLLKEVGKLDHVVHTAGDVPKPKASAGGKIGTFAASVEDTISFAMVRVLSAQILAKHAVKKLKRSNTSSITVTAGSHAERPRGNMGWATGTAISNYGLARGLAVEFAPIRVNCVCPGPVYTPLMDSYPNEIKDEIISGFKKRCLTGDLADPMDTAEAYLFSMKDRSCTGTIIHSESGFLLT